ncbi:MAG: VCBS repeat-containing protein [Ignavibacteriaceae bacterium]|nr:VCBS repeat-containing protein [Ignavibacteriaceae bacterium]
MRTSLLVFLIFTVVTASQAQIFTKITSGPMVNDGGDSRAVNWIDYDNDGDIDLFVTNGPQAGQNNFFYENNGDGTFTKITNIAITQDGKASDGSSWGDIDNDGDLDLFVANWWGQPNLLYLNNGDKSFTFQQGILMTTETSYSETGSWGDYNNDGYIDLYVCNSGGNLRNFLFKNNGDGTFTKLSGGILTETFESRNVDWIDFNNDGLPDIFVTNESNQNENLYLNNGDDTFSSASVPSLLQNGGSTAGSNWEDFDNDGDFDVLLVNWGNQRNQLYLNNVDGTFTKLNEAPFTTDISSSFGSSVGDIDNDGDLDIIISKAFTSQKTTNLLYINNNDGTFTKSNDAAVQDSGWTYGLAFGDYDNDGWLDLFEARCYNASENNVLFHNNGGSNNWVMMNLEGVISNRSAIGAIVKMKAVIGGNPVWQMRKVVGQNGYCGQNLQVHFGLGAASQIDSAIIQWPSGIIQNVNDLNINSYNTVVEDTTLVSVSTESNQPPTGFQLFQNYPNPFNPTTQIGFQIEESGFVTLKVYDVLGNEVAKLVDNYKPAGKHSVTWDANEQKSGVYFYTLISSNYQESKKMILLR